MALFAKRAAIRRNEEHFHGKRAAILGKEPQSLEKSCNPWIVALYKTGTFRKCGTHGGISAAHMEE